MTDRIRAVTVILDQDLRTDDAQGILDAIHHIRGVAQVLPHVVSPGDYMAREVVATELRSELHKAIEAVCNGRRERK